MSYIRTYSGIKFDPLNPVANDVDIHDIAHALSLNNRFSGHTKHAYSVAQHAVHVAELCIPFGCGYEALHHDDSEAYLSDVARPIKHTEPFAAYRTAEERLMAVIATALDFEYPEPLIVKEADKIMLSTEMRDLMGGFDEDLAGWPTPLTSHIHPWPAAYAEQQFLDLHRRLYEAATK